jgi:hypothetical protein
MKNPKQNSTKSIKQEKKEFPLLPNLRKLTANAIRKPKRPQFSRVRKGTTTFQPYRFWEKRKVKETRKRNEFG